MRRLAVLLALGLAACTSPTEPVHTATGMWKGVVGPHALTLSLTMHPDRSVSGMGVDTATGVVARFPVRGTVSGSTVVLLFTPESVDSGFSGRFTDGSEIQGALDFAGYSTTVALHRQ
jgi:hypothetical protein